MKIELCEVCGGKGFGISRNYEDPYDSTFEETKCRCCDGSGRMKKVVVSFDKSGEGFVTVTEISPYNWSEK